MIRYGFIHTKEDIKFLVLFAMDLLPFPVTFETVVDLITWCDDGFGYFELSEAFYEMIPTGHIDESIENGAKLYAITDKAFPVLDKCIEQGISRMRNFQRALVDEGFNLQAYSIDKIIDVDHASDIAVAQKFINE